MTKLALGAVACSADGPWPGTRTVVPNDAGEKGGETGTVNFPVVCVIASPTLNERSGDKTPLNRFGVNA
jgi:hypothetical protein